jgi:hypothetical protein
MVRQGGRCPSSSWNGRSKDIGQISTERREGDQKFKAVLKELGSAIQWVGSYVTDDKIYCVHMAPNEELTGKHAEKAGIPANRISQVMMIVDPTEAGVATESRSSRRAGHTGPVTNEESYVQIPFQDRT